MVCKLHFAKKQGEGFLKPLFTILSGNLLKLHIHFACLSIFLCLVLKQLSKVQYLMTTVISSFSFYIRVARDHYLKLITDIRLQTI